MIASLSGIVASRSTGQLVVDVNGVGYLVAVPTILDAEVSVGQSIRLHTVLVVREDSMSLFGFSSEPELRVFESLVSVTGIGPKLAMTILSQLGIEQISLAVANQDDRIFSSVTGIGPKTAKLLIVSLEGKNISVASTGTKVTPSSVLTALVGLGWREREASEALELSRRSLDVKASEQELLRATLTLLANDRSASKAQS